MTEHRKVNKERRCICGLPMKFNYLTSRWDCFGGGQE